MFKKILTPIDGSEESRAIVRWAAVLARANDEEITLLGVIDPEESRIVEATAMGAFTTKLRDKAGSHFDPGVISQPDVIMDSITELYEGQRRFLS